MFDKLIEQTQSVVKPFGDMMALNAKTLETITEKNTALFTGFMNDSVNYSKDLAAQKDAAGIFQLQKSYVESMQEKMVSASKEAYGVFSEAQEKAGDMVKGAIVEAKPVPTGKSK